MATLLFSGIRVGSLALRNRIVRSATYEGAADAEGFPGPSYQRLYARLGTAHIGLIITGFMYVSKEGRAMQPRQAGMDSHEKVSAYRRVTDAVHRGGTPIVAQLAHSGRQTRASVTGCRPLAPTHRRSWYFREAPRLIDRNDARIIIRQFVQSAMHAREAGFDGVQLHAAHGYLLHQMLLPGCNHLDSEFGIDRARGLGTAMADRILEGIRRSRGILPRALLRWYIRARVNAHRLPFSPMYNLGYAARATVLTDIPIISVGGMRSTFEMEEAIANGHTDLVAMSRPFLCEPEFVRRMEQSRGDCRSRCIHCNTCVVICDAGGVTTCHQRHSTPQEGQSS